MPQISLERHTSRSARAESRSGWTRGVNAIVLAAVLAATLPSALATADPFPAPPPQPKPPICGIWGCSDTAPVLPGVPAAAPLPVAPAGGWTNENPPPRSEATYWQDFDGDGVVNWNDNCTLVPNPDQAPAIKPADGHVPVNASSHAQAVEYKAQHPGAMYRTADELGEACSSYNENYRYTVTAFRVSSNDRKKEIFKFLGEGGPMWGADTLALVVPTCGRLDTTVNILEMLFKIPEGFLANALKTFLTPGITDHLSCSTGVLARLGEELGMAVWAGKHLYNPSNDGGAITNRFFPFPTEVAALKPLLETMPWLFPGGTGQTVQGHVRRDGGKSTIDGRDVISLDWRKVAGSGVGLEGNRWAITDESLTDLLNGLIELGKVSGPGLEGQIIRALPIALGELIKMTPLRSLDAQYLIYDACRAMQEGFTPCTVQVAAKRESDGIHRVFDEGWMPFTTIDPNIANMVAWEANHLPAMQPGYYNLPANNVDN